MTTPTDRSPAGQEPLLSVSQVVVRFGGLHALRDVSFEVNEGETFGIIGPNGAGKTTLLNAVSGLIRPRGGRISFRSREITRLQADRIASLGIGRSFQLAEGFARFSVWDYVRLGRVAANRRGWRHPEGTASFERGSEQALTRFDLVHLKDAQMGGLSYGTRKLVDLARVLASEPTLLLLDEPTSGLSRSERVEMGGHVRTLASEGRTVVVVDHDVGFISDVADRALALAYGKTICTGPPESVLADPGVVSSYLGSAKGG